MESATTITFNWAIDFIEEIHENEFHYLACSTLLAKLKVQEESLITY